MHIMEHTHAVVRTSSLPVGCMSLPQRVGGHSGNESTAQALGAPVAQGMCDVNGGRYMCGVPIVLTA